MFEIIGLYLYGKVLWQQELAKLAPAPVEIVRQTPVYLPPPIIENAPLPTVAPPATKPQIVRVEKEVKLKVPYHKQIYTLSCEAASLQMTLEYKGIYKTQDQLMEVIGYSLPRESYYKDGYMIWGDPDVGFVGNVNGKFSTIGFNLGTATGWGVSNIPINKAAKEFRPESEYYSGYTTAKLISEIDEGNPVIFWHKQDGFSSTVLYYKTETGKDIAFTRDHVAVVVGYKVVGGVTYFHINDPLYGIYAISAKSLSRWMNRMQGKVAVIR
jgi:uncharacterized protein YvpB